MLTWSIKTEIFMFEIFFLEFKIQYLIDFGLNIIFIFIDFNSNDKNVFGQFFPFSHNPKDYKKNLIRKLKLFNLLLKR